MSRSNPVGAKPLVALFACPALAAFPQLSDPDNAANGSVANFLIQHPVGEGGFGPHVFTFENVIQTKGPGTNQNTPGVSATLSIEVSADGTTWVATTAAANNTAVTQVVLAAGVRRAFDVHVGPNTPYVRIRAIGGATVEMGIDNAGAWQRLHPIGVPGF